MQKGIPEKPLKDVPRFTAPMRPKMVPSLPDDRSKWLLEPKLDGYRGALSVGMVQCKDGPPAVNLLTQ
jgi:ATP-dependent DNA ligase